VPGSSNAFKLDGGNLLLAKALDYKTQSHQHSITVKAKDAYGGEATKTFDLTVTNVADDTIQLAKSVFSKIAKKGVLSSSAFYSGNKAHDASIGSDTTRGPGRYSTISTARARRLRCNSRPCRRSSGCRRSISS
jgi:hypothetical protein